MCQACVQFGSYVVVKVWEFKIVARLTAVVLFWLISLLHMRGLITVVENVSKDYRGDVEN